MSNNSHSEDTDAQETQEWLEALAAVKERCGMERVDFLLNTLLSSATASGSKVNSFNTPYRNTILPMDEAVFPGDLNLEHRIRSLIRWNAVAMVIRAGHKDPDLGGHIGTFASSATLYEIGFNHFWRSATKDREGDLIFIQGHASPGIYARSFLEGVISEQQLNNFRQESTGLGVSSYPHPWLMPNYWQFPTVSMGLGPLQAIYQARFMKHLQSRGLIPVNDRKVWCFCGDGEMDEPESLGALTLAGRENLDNLIFVVNCNLQRLDGPVRGNSKIIQELEAVFKGAGWNVIKVIWGSSWDRLLEQDQDGLLQKRMDEVVDGDYQNYKAKDGAYVRDNFFGKYPDLKARVQHLTDDDIWRLKRGGHDAQKVYAAYYQAMHHTGQPTLILAKTVKGYGLGSAGEALNTAHNTKKMALEQLKTFRDRFNIPVTDDQIQDVPFYKPAENSAEMLYLKEKRQALGGYLPQRRKTSDEKLICPDIDFFSEQFKGSGTRDASTTMVFVRILAKLCKDKVIGKRIVPIIPDEARTFGMEGLFRQLGIYAHNGQLYTPVDSEQVMYYKEAKNGQILEEGINEGGAFCSWMAAATSYSNNNKAMIPFYVFYSMFGFQRIGDLAWAAGDLRSRGFLIGGTSGRTTLNGEGLQHEDGHSHVMAGLIPNCISYDPTYGYELAVIIQAGLKRMIENQEDIYYYITTMNENYQQPQAPDGCEEGILKGLYCLSKEKAAKIHLLGSGTILNEVIAAGELLAQDFDIVANIWSATSFNLLARDGLEVERFNRNYPEQKHRQPYVTECLANPDLPVVAATDYVKSYPEQIRQFIPKRYCVLGTDGFGRSDSRAKLREFFEVSRYYIVVAALKTLADEKLISVSEVTRAIEKYKINQDKINPLIA